MTLADVAVATPSVAQLAVGFGAMLIAGLFVRAVRSIDSRQDECDARAKVLTERVDDHHIRIDRLERPSKG